VVKKRDIQVGPGLENFSPGLENFSGHFDSMNFS